MCAAPVCKLNEQKSHIRNYIQNLEWSHTTISFNSVYKSDCTSSDICLQKQEQNSSDV